MIVSITKFVVVQIIAGVVIVLRGRRTMAEIRLIDANALKKAIMYKDNVNEETWEQLYDSVLSAIDNAPTVEYPFYAEAYQTGYEEGKNDRPKGEWKVNNYGDVYCSNCGIMALCKEFMADDFREVKTDYCAFCGADMRGDDE